MTSGVASRLCRSCLAHLQKRLSAPMCSMGASNDRLSRGIPALSDSSTGEPTMPPELTSPAALQHWGTVAPPPFLSGHRLTLVGILV